MRRHAQVSEVFCCKTSEPIAAEGAGEHSDHSHHHAFPDYSLREEALRR